MGQGHEHVGALRAAVYQMQNPLDLLSGHCVFVHGVVPLEGTPRRLLLTLLSANFSRPFPLLLILPSMLLLLLALQM